jgi:hypothetical protein
MNWASGKEFRGVYDVEGFCGWKYRFAAWELVGSIGRWEHSLIFVGICV